MRPGRPGAPTVEARAWAQAEVRTGGGGGTVLRAGSNPSGTRAGREWRPGARRRTVWGGMYLGHASASSTIWFVLELEFSLQ